MTKLQKQRTSRTKLNKKSRFPKWVIAVVLLLIAGTGLYLVYSSLASNSTDPRIGDNNNPGVTLYCKRDRSKCYWQQPQPPNTISTPGYVYSNGNCRFGLEYRLVGALKGQRKCLDVYVYP